MNGELLYLKGYILMTFKENHLIISRKLIQSKKHLNKEKSLDKLTQYTTFQNLQLSFFNIDDPLLEAIKDELLSLDINTLTPVEALMKLNEIKRMLHTK